jgi:WD40 repeat protein
VLTGSDNTTRLWDAATGEAIRAFKGHENSVTSLAFNFDGGRVLTGSDDKTARLWDAATGEEIRAFEGHENSITSVAFSPDGARVLTGSWDKTARLWDSATGKELTCGAFRVSLHRTLTIVRDTP